MSGSGWGTSSWGVSPWGTGVGIPAPGISAVSPGEVDTLGGTVLTILGENFSAPVVVEFYLGGVKVGEGVVFDNEFDVAQSKIYAGTPALLPGSYAIQVITDGGPSGLLEDAVVVKPFADQMKIQKVRSQWAPIWRVGKRLLKD